MRDEDGTYGVTEDEVRAFHDSGKKYWFMNYDGSPVFLDEQDLGNKWPVYMMNSSPEWWAQWNGDYGAAAQQLRDAMARTLTETELPPPPSQN